MKQVIYFLTFILFISCAKEPKDYAKVSGLIANNEATEISFISRGFKKTIPVNPDGTFSDTIKVVTKGLHTFFDGKNKKVLFLDNGNVLNMSYDYDNLNGSIKIDGKGSETNNYILEKTKFDIKERVNDLNAYYQLEKGVFETRIAYLEAEVEKLLATKGIDSTIRATDASHYKRIFANVMRNYDRNHLMTTKLGQGKPSPKFANYVNYKGGKTSLDDLKGKYVYVDVWATWCGPCKQQIPYLKKIEKEYHNKNIEFVSISVDDARRNGNSWDNARDKWKKMVKDQKLGGVQLFADRGFQSEFIKAYGITSIPRFLLIDPEGNIVNSNAPRPSQPGLKTILDGLL